MAIRRRTWIIGSIVGGLIATFAILLAAAHLPITSDRLRRKVETTLGQSLESDVELGGLTLHLAPRIQVVGEGLVVHHKGRRDLPPLMSIRRFTVHAGFLALAHGHISSVIVEGLDLEIPPGPERTLAEELQHDEDNREARARARRERAATKDQPKGLGRQFVVDSLTADEARMAVLSRDPGKEPKVWVMHQLRLQNVGVDRSMPIQSKLENGVPPGDIDTTGTFGPWDADEPGDTPLAGDFTLAHADLSVFKGISGIVSAHGAYTGTLGTIRTAGETESADFMIGISHHPVPLKTAFRAVVDATDGDTMLEEVDATFLGTSLVAKGGIYDVKGAKGRLLMVDVTMERGRIEDVMQLVVNTPHPPMVGALSLRGKLVLPPGDVDVVEKIKLNGSFRIGRGRFTDDGVQGKVNDLSRRASGKIKDETPETHKVTSNFEGTFAVAGGSLRVPRVTFDVPGALVDISGQCGLRPPQALAFSGNLYMDAKISQMTTGFKSLLLKVVDPFFRHDGRTIVPLKISGTRNDPSFGLDVKRVFSRGGDAGRTAGR